MCFSPPWFLLSLAYRLPFNFFPFLFNFFLPLLQLYLQYPASPPHPHPFFFLPVWCFSSFMLCFSSPLLCFSLLACASPCQCCASPRKCCASHTGFIYVQLGCVISAVFLLVCASLPLCFSSPVLSIVPTSAFLCNPSPVHPLICRSPHLSFSSRVCLLPSPPLSLSLSSAYLS